MSVPLNRLYRFLQDICNRDDLIIYRFFPDGSRKITDLSPVDPQDRRRPQWVMICHDQEPLDPEWFERPEHALHWVSQLDRYYPQIHLYDKQNLIDLYSKLNLRMPATMPHFQSNLTPLKTMLLTHSEKRSPALDWYEKNLNFAGVYYWSHAVIARDWFRFAKYDPSLDIKNIDTDFLVYNRAWSGSREYRLKFAELLIDAGITQSCVMGFRNTDDNVHYTKHQYRNSELAIARTDLDEHFFNNQAASTASADYMAGDYQRTGIEVVLETLFDDARLHLTEKALRPIACGQPFILAATAGSLEYMRSYGFETFAPWIDETYDTIENPAQRLQAIVQEMKRIANLDSEAKAKLYNELRNIALRNKQLFFSDAWHAGIVDEFYQNFKQALLRETDARLQWR